MSESTTSDAQHGVTGQDDLFNQAVMLVWSENKASTSFIQRKLAIGYNKAASLVERMETMGIVSAPNVVGRRIASTPEDLRKALQLHKDIVDAAGDDLAPAILSALVAKFPTQDRTTASATANPFKGRPPMKDAPDFRKQNDAAFCTTGQELKQFIERVERLEQEKAEVAEQIKEVFAEVKGRGFDVKAIRTVIRERKQDPNDVAEQEAIIDMYKSALGMA